jgi:hypothetical protein
MDKGWTKLPRFSREYKKGVLSFLDFAYTKGKPEGMKFYALVPIVEIFIMKKEIRFMII